MTDSARVLLIDGHSMAFRAFYAMGTDRFLTSGGQHTGAVYGFCSMLLRLLKDQQPTHLGVAFDHSRVSFRTSEYPDYKATRGETPPEFRGQVELIKDLLSALHVVNLEWPDFEADDILATWADQAAAAGCTVQICSGDRDMIQLVNDQVTLLYPRRGVSELDEFTPAAVQAKYGVPPQRYPEIAALVGETSDNLPGVPGVGPKTAAKWLNEYDGLDGLLANIASVGGKAGESLRAHVDDVRRNRRLNRLVRDVKLPIAVAELELQPIDVEQVTEFFDLLEFGATLRKELFDVFAKPDDAVVPPAAVVQGVALTPGALGDWLRAASAEGTVSLDLVGHWARGSGDVELISLCQSDGRAIWFDPTELDPTDEQAWSAWLAADTSAKALHGAKHAYLAAWPRGWQLGGVDFDTELAAYLLRPDQRSYELSRLEEQYFKRQLATSNASEDPVAQDALDFSAPDERRSQAAQESMVRAGAVQDLASAFTDELTEQGQLELLHDMELPLARVLARMEAAGIAVDPVVLGGLRDEFDARVLAAQTAAFDVLGKEINLGSPKQLQAVLFDELQMPKTKRTKSGYTTDAEALESLFARTEHPFLAHLLAHRDAIKLRQIVDSLLEQVADDERIHTTFQQTVAATGRLSSVGPNLQNIPIRTEAGRRVREGFVAGPGFAGLLSADYSQIEMRVMADASQDAELIAAFRSGVDFHTVTASRVFGVAPSDVTGEQRASVKQMNYGLAYGLSAYGLSTRLGVSVGEAKSLMDDYFETFGRVRDYLQGIVAQARQSGYTETKFGRRRYLPDLTSSNYQRREMAERAALNAPIQGTAADIIKIAMIRLDEQLRAGGFTSRMLLQVHDELIIEVAPDEHDAVVELVTSVMGGAVELAVPLDVSIGFGRSWAAAAH